MRIIIERKAKYTLTALIITAVLLISANALADTPVFYNTLSQITKTSAGTDSVDADSDGTIDLAETISGTIEISKATGLSASCPGDELMTGLTANGVPICTETKIVCKYTSNPESDICYLAPSGGITTIEEVPKGIQITLHATGSISTGKSPADITYTGTISESQDITLSTAGTIEEARTKQYCSADSDQPDTDWMCLKEIHSTPNGIRIIAQYSHYGQDNMASIEAQYTIDGTKIGTITKQLYTTDSGAPTSSRQTGETEIILQ